jgi:hypothetical protein
MKYLQKVVDLGTLTDHKNIHPSSIIVFKINNVSCLKTACVADVAILC